MAYSTPAFVVFEVPIIRYFLAGQSFDQSCRLYSKRVPTAAIQHPFMDVLTAAPVEWTISYNVLGMTDFAFFF